MNAPLRGSRVILSVLGCLLEEDASMALYPPMLFRLLAEEEEVPTVALAAAKSLNEFCLANSLKADSKVDGVAGTAELLTLSAGAFMLRVACNNRMM